MEATVRGAVRGFAGGLGFRAPRAAGQTYSEGPEDSARAARRPLPALGAPLCLHLGGALGAGGRSSEAAAPCPPPRPGRRSAEGAGFSEPRPSPARLHRGARTLLRHRDQTWSVVRSFRKLPILGQAVCLRAKEQCVNRSRPFKNKNKIEGSDGAPRRSWDAPGSRAGL